jgi:tyrosine-specific transport protein
MTTNKLGFAPNTFTASLLVAGTCIGAGMLALPVTAAPTGFIPSLTLMGLAWFMMTVTGLCLVEVGSWMKKHDAHIMTMTQTILGPYAKGLVWVLFLFISYASLIAYTAECGNLLARAVTFAFGLSISKTAGCFLFAAIFGPFLLGPRHILGKANDLLFFAMVASYVVFIVKGVPTVRPELLLREDWSVAYMAIPLLITAFSFQTMVPSLHSFLDDHKKSLRLAVALGTTIAFFVYALWLFVILGSIPLEGPTGLAQALEHGVPATHCLNTVTHSLAIPYASSAFALFALVTSFFGLGIGLFDFLSDGLKIQKKGRGALLLGLLVILPSLFFAISYERIFIVALDISGGFGDTILNGIIPLLLLSLGVRIFAPRLSRWPFIRKGGTVLLFCLFLIAFAAEVILRMNDNQTQIAPDPSYIQTS